MTARRTAAVLIAGWSVFLDGAFEAPIFLASRLVLTII
jgi:hypothetical protein